MRASDLLVPDLALDQSPLIVDMGVILILVIDTVAGVVTFAICRRFVFRVKRLEEWEL